MPELYFEDFAEGQEFPLGPCRVSREEIIAFAAEFDPQPFHLDEVAASESTLGGLAASGWHSCALFMRMMCESWIGRAASMGAPGVDFVEWHAPVRPDSVLKGRTIVLETRSSKSRGDRGFVRTRHEIETEAGDRILVLETPIMIARRDPEPAAT